MAFNKNTGYKNVNTGEMRSKSKRFKECMERLNKIDWERDDYSNMHHLSDMHEPLYVKAPVHKKKNFHIRGMKAEDCLIYSLFMFFALFFCVHLFFNNPFVYNTCNVTHIDYPAEFPNATYRKDWNLCTFESVNVIPWAKKNFTVWSPCITFYTENKNTSVPIYDMNDRHGDKNCTLACDFLLSFRSKANYGVFMNWFVKNYSDFMYYPTHIPCIYKGDYYEGSRSFFSFTYFKKSMFELFS